MWKTSHIEKSSTEPDGWANSKNKTAILETHQSSPKFKKVRIRLEVPQPDPSLTQDFKIKLVCDRNSNLFSPYSNFLKSRLGVLAPGVVISNPPYSLSNIDEVNYDFSQLIPKKVPQYLFNSKDNKELRFLPKEETIKLLNTEGLVEMDGKLVWSDDKRGYILNIVSGGLITGKEVTAEVLNYYDHQMGEHLSRPFRLADNGKGGWVTEEAIGDLEIVGKLIYIKYSNKKIPFMAILQQNEDCYKVI